MKKLLSLLLVAILAIGALSLAACFPGNTPETPATEPSIEDAKEFLLSLLEDEATVTPSDYTLPAQVIVGDYTYTVTWTTDREDITVTVDGATAKIDLNEKTPEAIEYTLTATISYGDLEPATVSRKCTIPAYLVVSFEDYMAANQGDVLTVEGIVVAMNGKSVGNSRNHLFLADASGKGGYYCYQLDDDPVAAGVKVGMTVSVTATVEPYSGMQELKGGTFQIVSSEITPAAVKDITADFAAGNSLKNYVGLAVTIKGVEIGAQDLGNSHDYLYFKLNGKDAYVRSYLTDFPTSLQIVVDDKGTAVSSPDKTAIEETHAAKFGWTANVTGILVLYSGNPYLIPMGTDCFEYLELVEKTPAEKIADEIEAVKLPDAITADTVLELPLTATYHDVVKLAWAVDNTAFVIGEDGKVEIKLGSDAVTLKFTLTLTVGEGDAAVTETKEYTVQVAANLVMSVTRPYIPFLNQGETGKVLYLDGGVNGRYLTTTEDASKAVEVFAEKATGGYKFYILVDGVKNYITVYKNADKKDSVNYDPNGTSVFSYNPVVNAFVTDLEGTPYYLGTYSTFATISASKLSFINAENTGKSQFPLELLAAKPEGTYTGSVTQAKLENKVLYLDGGVSDRYLTTTEDASKAVTLYAEKVAGGFKFYILVDDVKNYVTIYKNADNKDSVKYDPNGTCVFAYNAIVNAWVTDFGGVDYYLGTYKTFNTISASKLSFINADNTGVEQFPLEYNAVVVEVAPPTADHDHADANGDYVCDTENCDEVILPAADSTLTIPQANAIGVLTTTTTKFYVTGTIKNIYQLVHGNMYIVDADGNELCIYGSYNATGATKYGQLTTGKWVAGDVVTVYGVLSSFNGKAQMVDGWVTVDTHNHTYADATCTAPKTCACGATEGEALGHKYVNGTCSVCNASEPAANEVTVTAKYTGTTTTNMEADKNNAASLGLDANVFTVTANKGDQNNNVGLNKGGDFRLYGHAEGNGNELTIAVAAGYEIKSIKITFVSTSYAGTMTVTVDGTVVVTADGSTAVVTANINGSSFVLKNTNKSTTQIRITSIEIVYAPVAE